MTDKEEIINRFYNNVKGKIPDVSSSNVKHDGKYGHWLEKRMDIKPNANNAPDLFGYEMKNQTSSGKITYGDWSASEYIFLGKSNIRNGTNKNFDINRSTFLKIFGKPNKQKNNRISWSGTPCPTYYLDQTSYGQILEYDQNKNIVITYSYSLDQRNNKKNIVPSNMKQNRLIIAKWLHQDLKKKLEKKFNQKGWFMCKKALDGSYESICFGQPLDFKTWLKLFEDRIVFFDSGMYEGNDRPYSQWRSDSKFWYSLITDEY